MSSAEARTGAAVFVVVATLYALLAAPIPFYDKGEPREAMVVRALLAGHDLVLPRRDGTELPSKPPLFHWLAALALQAGVRPEELAVRLPSVLLGAAAVAVTAVVTMRAQGRTAGLIAALVLGSSFEWLRAATEARVDMTLAFLVLVAVLAWHGATAGRGGPGLVRLGAAAAAAAVLTKGPVGLALPALIVAAAALARRDVSSLRRLADVPAALGVLAVCGGWYVLASMRGGAEFAGRHLVQENLQRFVGWGHVAHRHAAGYYLPALAASFLPWTLALWPAARRLRRGVGAHDRFLLVWIATVLAFFSLAAGKRSAYLLPLFPPLAVLTGAGLAETVERGPGSLGRWTLRAGAVALAALGAVVLVDPRAAMLAERTGLLEGSDVARLPAAVAALEAHRTAVSATLGALAASLVVLSGRAPGGAGRRLGALAAVAVAASLGLTAFGTHPVATRLTTRDFASRVHDRLRPGDHLCACGDLDWPLRYYLAQPVPRCSRRRRDTRRTLVIRARRAPGDGSHRYGLAYARGGTACDAGAP